MRIVGNSIPKSGTHLLLRLITQLGFDLVDFGGIRPRRVPDDGGAAAERALRSFLGLRKPDQFLGIGPYLVEGGPLAPARTILRTRGPEKVTVGVDLPRSVGRRWLERRLNQVPEDSVVSAHCAYSPQLADLVAEQKMRTVCIIRDPRDTAVSHMHYLKKLTKHPIYDEYMRLADDHERLMLSIRGGRLGERTLLPLAERYRRFLDWESEGGAAMVKFEELVGPRGGGSEGSQRAAIERVAEHLEVDLDGERLSYVQQGLFGSGRTFRKGRVGGWTEEFSEEHKEAVRECTGRLLIELGYEKDEAW